MVEKINSCIELALDKACPLTKSKVINKNNPWWTDQLEDLRTQVTNAYKRLLLNPIEGHKTRYKKLVRSYKNLCFKRKEADISAYTRVFQTKRKWQSFLKHY